MAECILVGNGGSGDTNWVTDIPEMHRNIFRGKYLGTSVATSQLAAVDAGTFDDLYIGDYWTVDGVNWRIADIDYCSTVTTHHLLMFPDSKLYDAVLNTSRSSNIYYVDSTMFSANLEQAKTTINTSFPNMVLPFEETYGTGSSTITTHIVTAEIPYPMMLTGNILMMKATDIGHTHSVFQEQLALFRLCPRYRMEANENIYWLRDNPVISSGYEYLCFQNRMGIHPVNLSAGVRPYFLLGDASE